jgi:acetolactate synthase-1/2/3 large subunit
MPGALDLGDVFAYLRERLPRTAIITNGAGNYIAWRHRSLQFSVYHPPP